MSFRFNFGGGDSDSEDVPPAPIATVQAAVPVRTPKYHTLEDLVRTPRGKSWFFMDMLTSRGLDTPTSAKYILLDP